MHWLYKLFINVYFFFNGVEAPPKAIEINDDKVGYSSKTVIESVEEIPNPLDKVFPPLVPPMTTYTFKTINPPPVTNVNP